MGDICCCQRQNNDINDIIEVHHHENAKIKIMKVIEVVNSLDTFKEKLKHLDYIFKEG